MASFWKPEACGQTVLPDRSVLIGQKLVENAKIHKCKCDILSNFPTLCTFPDFLGPGLVWAFEKMSADISMGPLGTIRTQLAGSWFSLRYHLSTSLNVIFFCDEKNQQKYCRSEWRTRNHKKMHRPCGFLKLVHLVTYLFMHWAKFFVLLLHKCSFVTFDGLVLFNCQKKL